MEFSNILLLSLKQDINVLNKISLEIVQGFAHFELNSWLFPTKSYEYVTKILSSNSTSRKQYLNYLEFTIDRLHLVVNLLLKYVEMHSSGTYEQKVRNVIRPNNLSLGTATDLLWKKIVDIKDLIETKKENITETSQNQKKFVDSSDAQTDTYSSHICNSCAIATSCIRQIVNDIATYLKPSQTEQIRKDVKENLYEITQHGCMHKLTTSITQDFKNFIERLRNLEMQNEKLGVKVDNLTMKYGESLQMIRGLQGLLKNVQKRLRNVKLKNKSLSRKLNELKTINQEKDCKINKGNEKLRILEKSIKETEASLALLGTDNEKLHRHIQRAVNDNVNVSQEKELWKNRFTETYLDSQCLQAKLDKQQREIEELKTAMNKINKHCKKLTTMLEITNIKIAKKTEMFEKFLKSTDPANLHKLIDTTATATTQKSEHTLKLFQLTGDPIADMNRQLEINIYDIKKLEQYNANLVWTIKRVQEKKCIQLT